MGGFLLTTVSLDGPGFLIFGYPEISYLAFFKIRRIRNSRNRLLLYTACLLYSISFPLSSFVSVICLYRWSNCNELSILKTERRRRSLIGSSTRIRITRILTAKSLAKAAGKVLSPYIQLANLVPNPFPNRQPIVLQ
jgi:hypothetical protein